MMSLVPILACLSALAQVWCVTPLSRFAVDMHFHTFIQQHNRVYENFQERESRHRIFMQNLQRLYEMGRFYPHGNFDFTPYMDHTLEEFVMTHAGLKLDESNHLCSVVTDRDIPYINAPDKLDWRDYNVVSPVKDQKNCNSCYAFSATGNIEGQFALKYSKPIQLSEQQIVDCDKRSGGCGGGYMTSAFSSLMEAGGSKLEADYPYVENNPHPQCFLSPNQIAVRVVGCHYFKLSSQEKLKQLLYHRGPLSIGVRVEVLHMDFFKGKIIPDEHCSGEVNHGVLLVGYGEENGIPYWIVKNSWGETFGDHGYFKLQRGEGLDSCGMMSGSISSAVIA